MAHISFEKAIEIALEQHHAGHLQRAETLYLEILRQDPGNVEAIHLLGVLAHQGKRPDLAEELISRAVGRRGDVAVYHYNLAEAQRAQGKLAEAAASFRRTVELAPEYAEAYNNLAIVLHEQADFKGAIEAGRRAVELQPDAPAPHNNLANALRGNQDLSEAEASYLKALAVAPDFANAMSNLGTLIASLGRMDEAIEWFNKALRTAPTDARTHNNLGSTLSRMGRHREAARCFETAIELDPENAEAQNNFGAALRNLGHREQSIARFERAIELKPDFAAARINLICALKDVSRNADALVAVDEAIALRPDSASERFLRAMILRDLSRNDESLEELHAVQRLAPDDIQNSTSLAYAHLERGDMEEAKAAMDRAVALKPDASTLSNVLMTANYHPAYSPAHLHSMHSVWRTLHEDPHRPIWGSYANTRDPQRRLRVGYVSPDFRGHVVAHFLEPILENHDHERFEIFGYANLTNVDMHTWKMRAQIDQWREIAQKSPDEIARQIRADEIDILIELAGHTGNNTLPVFARKPAPIQINMIGFPSTTGLSAMDYRITDTLCDPPGESDLYNSETLLRMPRLFWVFNPSPNTPDIGPLPADINGFMTFTSVNNFTKVTPDVQRMWARLLLAVPNSRLILQTAALNSEQTRAAVRARFVEIGVDPARLDFRPYSDLGTFFKLVNETDITLDPFPFNGGTTTCHSLWMGAPVLTLAGDRHASRMGLSMMTNVGLPEFVAHTPDEYVAIGKRMAEDLSHLREVRRTMRERLNASPLLDAPGYTRELEVVYRDVWTKWCANPPA